MFVVDIAQSLYLELLSPSYTSVASIAYWIRAQLGTINTLLYEDFTITASGNYEILDPGNNQIDPTAVAVIKQLYRIYDLNTQIRNLNNGIINNPVLKFSDQDTSVTRVNPSELIKSLILLRKEETAALTQMINAYRMRGAAPSQIAGDDTQRGWYYPNREFVGESRVGWGEW